MDKNILKNIPVSPWIYKYFDRNWKIIYIWKSVNLKSRVNSYFNWTSKLNFAKQKMVSQIEKIETILTNNENEALILETNLIKEHKPKYNILMKDDKNHTYLKLWNNDWVLTLIKTRHKNKIWEYFWPYSSWSYVKNTIILLKKIFGYWNSDIVFKEIAWWYELYNRKLWEVDCLDYYISKSNYKQKRIDFDEAINEIKNFLNWDYKKIFNILAEKMNNYAKNLEFEEAQKIKVYLETLAWMQEHQVVRDFIEWNHEIINILKRYDNFYIWVTKIKDSKIIWYNNYKVENKLWETDKEILEFFVTNRYIANYEKLNIILPYKISINKELLNSMKISLEFPQIWGKIELLKFVYKNILTFAQKEHLESLSTKSYTKKNMQNILDLLWYEKINDKIIFECNDISHLWWTHTVASRSVIENWKTANSKYKKFNIKTLEEDKIDDFESMREIMTRRIKEIRNTRILPDLIIIDWWKWQLSSVVWILEKEIKNSDEEDKKLLEKLQLVSIAKREEELFLPWESKSIMLEKDSLELRLVQRIRDEAHRFAITFNRDKRIVAMKKNILEEIPWIWPKSRQALLKEFWSLEEIWKAKIEDLRKILNKNQIEQLENHWII